MRPGCAGLVLAAVASIPAVAAQCTPNPAALDDPTLMLGLEMQFLLEVEIKIGGELVVANNTTVSIASGVHEPTLDNIDFDWGKSDADLYATGQDVTVTVAISRQNVTLARESSATNYATTCHLASCTGGSCFSVADFQTAYFGVVYAPGVDPTPSSGCPPNGTGVASQSWMEVDACFSPKHDIEVCQTVEPCSRLEYHTNPDRKKTEQTTCDVLTVCANGESETHAPTATTDRVCAERTSPCVLENGYRTENTGPVPTCAEIKPCDLSTTYMKRPATAYSDPVCVSLVGECDNAASPPTYEAIPPDFQTNRLCKTLTAVCNSTVADLETVVEALDARPPVDFFEKTGPTPTSDRVCAPATVCNYTETLSTPLTSTSDRTCAAFLAEPPIPGPDPHPVPSGTPALIWGCVATMIAAAAYVNFSRGL